MTKEQDSKEKFVVVHNMFGDYWVGKTALSTKSTYPTFDEATEAAKEMTDSHSNIAELEEALEDECEIVGESLKKWIV